MATVQVPSVVGLLRSAAEQQLTGAGLTTGNVTETASSMVSAGIVMDTNPSATTAVEAGSAVNLNVSTGPAKVAVPDVLSQVRAAAEQKLKDAGLTIRNVTDKASETVSAGKVIGTSPTAGTMVNPGSPVDLEISSGPAPVIIPDVVGLTRTAAETVLRGHGLVVGAVRTRRSDSVPADGVHSTEPQSGTPVQARSAVGLVLSSGPRFSWAQSLPTLLFAALGISVLLLIIYIVAQDGQEFLLKLAEKEVARGLITFLIAISTVGIAIILAISTVVSAEGPEGDKRFDRGKQVLSILIGVLGTIVGFYFGSADTDAARQRAQTEQQQKQQTQPRISTTTLPNGSANAAYTSTTLAATGLTIPLKWTVTPALPDGLTLNPAAGTISGTPKAASKQTYRFEVTDSSNPPKSSSANLELEIR